MKNDAWYDPKTDVGYKDDIRHWFKNNAEIKKAKATENLSLDLENPEQPRDWTKPPPGSKEIVCPFEEGKARVGTQEFTSKYTPT